MGMGYGLSPSLFYVVVFSAKNKYTNYYVSLIHRLTIKIKKYESNQIFWN